MDFFVGLRAKRSNASGIARVERGLQRGQTEKDAVYEPVS
jgi:hypothetical protein